MITKLLQNVHISKLQKYVKLRGKEEEEEGIKRMFVNLFF